MNGLDCKITQRKPEPVKLEMHMKSRNLCEIKCKNVCFGCVPKFDGFFLNLQNRFAEISLVVFA